MRNQRHRDRSRSVANWVENVTVVVSSVLLIVGVFAGNAFNLRIGGSHGVDWALLSVWLGASAICLVVGLCLTTIWRQVARNARERARCGPVRDR